MFNFSIEADIAKATTLDASFYTDHSCFEVSKEKVFSSTWQFVGNTFFVNEPGQCYPFFFVKDFIDEPLLLTRNELNSIFCLSNVCTHRGNILIDKPCNTRNIRCRYHGRQFRLNGTFQSMPEFKEVQNFPSANDNLHQLDLFEWKGLLFTSLRPKFPFKFFFNEMLQRIHWMPVNEFVFRPELSKEYFVNAHWALYCENYLEGFHIPFVHSGLNAVIDYGSYTTELFRYSNLQIGIAKRDDSCFELPALSPDHGKKIAAYYFWVFPNMMFNFYPWGLSINIVQPLAIDKTRVCFYTYVWKEELRNMGAGNDLDKVEMEDEEVVENVQKGIRSRFYRHGRYSVTREQGTHHFHRLLAEFMN